MVNYQLFFSTFVPKISKTIEMKRLFYPILILLCAILYVSCDNYETYGDKKAKERDAINKFISENNIKVINEDQFEDQGLYHGYGKKRICPYVAYWRLYADCPQGLWNPTGREEVCQRYLSFHGIQYSGRLCHVVKPCSVLHLRL